MTVDVVVVCQLQAEDEWLSLVVIAYIFIATTVVMDTDMYCVFVIRIIPTKIIPNRQTGSDSEN